MDAAERYANAFGVDLGWLLTSLDPSAMIPVGSLRRIREADLVVPTLVYLASQAGGAAKTSKIIAHLEERFRPAGEDAATLKGRGDSRFSQIVRNMISHRKDAGSFINNGYAEYLSDLQGLKITEKGRKLLRELVNEG